MSAVSTAIALLSGCALGGVGERDRAAAGPLSANAGTGTYALYAAPAKPWEGTFGFALCTAQGERAVVEGVRWATDESVKPLEVRVFARHVDKSGATPRQRGAYLPFASGWGAPPWNQPYVTDTILGDFEPITDGSLIVDRECEGPTAAAQRFTELLISVRSGPSGARLESASIDYTVNGSQHTLPIDVELITCGSAAALREVCADDPSLSAR